MNGERYAPYKSQSTPRKEASMRDSQQELTCIDCKTSKIVYKCQVRPGPSQRYMVTNGIYRCKQCWDKKRKELPHWNPNKGEIITLKCVECGTEKQIQKSQTSRYSAQYRCKPCDHATRKQRSPDTKEEVQCPVCGKTRKYKPSYAKRVGKLCGKCKNLGDRNGSWKGGNVSVICNCCGKETIYRQSPDAIKMTQDKNYKCSQCSLKHRPTGENNPSWRGGISFAPYSPEWTSALKQEVRQADNYTCQICGAYQPNRRKMPVHHIDYNKNNSSKGNLITLCIVCHSKTNYKRDQWQKILTEKRTVSL